MKKISLYILFISSFILTSQGQFIVNITSTPGGSFDNAISSTWSPPAAGSEQANNYFQDGALFQTIFVTDVGNRDAFKTGTANGAWDASKNEHTFTINHY